MRSATLHARLTPSGEGMRGHDGESPSIEVRCPVCQSRSARFKYEVNGYGRFRALQCRNCTLAYAWPRPSGGELQEFYSSDYFQRSTPAGNLGYADYRAFAEINARRMWAELQCYVGLDRSPVRSLLDVGCATGGFLAEAKKDGWACTGVELSEHAADVARNELQLNVLTGSIDEPRLPVGAFGVITMWHVLEHMIEPLAALKRARELTAAGGFVFIEVPNWNSVGRMIKGSSWSQLKPPEHINFFTPRALTWAATSAGLHVLRCSTHYPSLHDRAAVRRPSRPGHLLVNWIARAACKVGRGGYLRLLTTRP